MTLSEWARVNGIPYKTAWRWWKRGILPVPTHQTPSGRVLVNTGAVLYARVPSPDQKPDLDRQLSRLSAFAAEQGIAVTKVVTEIGRKNCQELLAILRSPEYKTIIVERRDKTLPCDAEYVEAALAAAGRQLIAVEQDEQMQAVIDSWLSERKKSCPSG